MMDFRIKDRETLEKLLKLGEEMHKESPALRDLPFSHLKVAQLLMATQQEDSKYFLVYSRDAPEIQGVFIGYLFQPYYSNSIVAGDLAMFLKPEYRGSTVFLRMLKSFEEWAKGRGASRIRLGHETGIDTEKAPKLFNRLGYSTAGYSFNKEL